MLLLGQVSVLALWLWLPLGFPQYMWKFQALVNVLMSEAKVWTLKSGKLWDGTAMLYRFVLRWKGTTGLSSVCKMIRVQEMCIHIFFMGKFSSTACNGGKDQPVKPGKCWYITENGWLFASSRIFVNGYTNIRASGGISHSQRHTRFVATLVPSEWSQTYTLFHDFLLWSRQKYGVCHMLCLALMEFILDHSTLCSQRWPHGSQGNSATCTVPHGGLLLWCLYSHASIVWQHG